ncbi:MAG: (Fe-S)-binding protein [Gammaproteobacteria bacterium]|nr:(Fe-S)-binding protein [Gammaproteobacteria bacterium]
MTTFERLLGKADQCVKCGLCLPHCPTYRLNRNEGDSPRGRISLIQAWVGGQVESVALEQHLDRCLGCRACESICPSGVKYGELIDGIRAADPRSESLLKSLLLGMATSLPYLPATEKLLRLHQKSGLAGLVSRIGPSKIRRLQNLLSPLEATPQLLPLYPAMNQRLARVGLFTGCVGRVTERRALDAAIRVLNRIGVEVVIPPQQRCCGALHLHAGDPETAKKLAGINREAFGQQPLDSVLYLASGCGIQLADYSTIGGPLDSQAMEISEFLNTRHWPPELTVTPLNRRILVHTPCSMRHVLKGGDAPLNLLQRIPGIKLEAMPDMGCCGAAGSYVVSQPGMADALRQRTLDMIWERNPEILITSNTGCALHLTSGLRKEGLLIETMHPVQLLDRQMGLK